MLKELDIRNIKIKWPNDIFVNNKKIAGILLESKSQGAHIKALVIGVGINVNSIKFSENMSNTPTSICLELNRKIELSNIKKNIYDKFVNMLDKIKNGDFSYLKTIRENNYLKGKKVYALICGKKILVEVIDINDDNSLKIKKEDEYINLYSGEITFNI